MFSGVKNIQKNAKLQNWSNYNELLLFDVKTIKKNSKLQTRSNYDQFASIWRQNNRKHWGTVAKHSKQRKTTKRIKLQLIASICLQNNPKCWDTSQNYESDQIIVHCIDLTSKRSKLLSYVAKLQNDQITMNCFYLMSKWSKQLKTTNSIKLRSICIDLTSKQSKTLRYGRKTFKTTQNYESANYSALHRFDV